MGGGTIQYRCRRCGKVDGAIHVPEVLSAVVELANRGKVSGDGVPCHEKHLHTCGDGGFGISDAIGAVPDAKSTKPPLLADGWTLVSWEQDEGHGYWRLCAASRDAHDGVLAEWLRYEDGQWVLGWARTNASDSELQRPPLREGD